MNGKVTWQGELNFAGVADSGFPVKMDTIPATGGHDSGVRPTELLALGIAGCTGMDVISILRKKRVEVSAFEVRVNVQRAEEHPKVFTHIAIEYLVTGKGINQVDVERAVQLSEEKYCPAIAMFRQVAEMSHSITIIEG